MVKRLHAEIKYQSDTGNVVSYDDYQALAAELAVQEDRHDIEVSDLAMREHALTARIADLEAALKGLYGECCYAGHDNDKDYAWPAVMKQAKDALTPVETDAKPLSEKCPKCGTFMFNWPEKMTKCVKCQHEWYMDSSKKIEGKR